MIPGPLPDPDRRRRNKPQIPTTALPAAGFAGPYPRPPKWVTLGASGSAWWRWAWRTPQAAAWSTGDLVVVATRATLEDDLSALAGGESDADKLKILKQAVDIDDRLGLTPKGRLALRMTIVEADTESARVIPASTTRRLRAVDASAAG